MVIDFELHFILVVLNFPHSFVSHLKLVSQVIDVSFKSFDFGDVILLFLLELLDGEA